MRKLLTLTLPLMFCAMQLPVTAYAGCWVPAPIEKPNLYSVGLQQQLTDLYHWRDFNPKEIANAGRLIPSPDGQMIGEPLAGVPTCNILGAGEYIFVMKWQDTASKGDYIENTDIVYLKQPKARQPDYIAHSQLGGNNPVFCAGTFTISLSAPRYVQQINEVYEVTNSSGHYKPECKCLGVMKEKLLAMGVDVSSTILLGYDNPVAKTCPRT